MIKFALAMTVILAACGGGDDGGGGGTIDAAGSNVPACTKALYDNCMTNADCDSGNCHYYMQQNFTVCTQACSASNPCPNDSSGMPGTCNNMGICKPAKANSCHL